MGKLMDDVVELDYNPNPTIGRPSTYTPELGRRVADIIATNPCGVERLNKMFEEFPTRATIFKWVNDYSDFSDMYFSAKRKQSHVIFDSIDDMQDEVTYYIDTHGNKRIDAPSVALAAAKATNRKWQAARLEPKSYGDKQGLEQVEANQDAIRAELQAVRDELAKKAEREY